MRELLSLTAQVSSSLLIARPSTARIGTHQPSMQEEGRAQARSNAWRERQHCVLACGIQLVLAPMDDASGIILLHSCMYNLGRNPILSSLMVPLLAAKLPYAAENSCEMASLCSLLLALQRRMSLHPKDSREDCVGVCRAGRDSRQSAWRM